MVTSQVRTIVVDSPVNQILTTRFVREMEKLVETELLMDPGARLVTMGIEQVEMAVAQHVVQKHSHYLVEMA